MAVLTMARQSAVALLTAALIAGCTATPTAPPTPNLASAAAPTVTPNPTPIPTVKPTVAPTVTPTPAPVGWREVPAQDSLWGVAFSDIIWTGSRFVATGEADGRAVFLDSTDGIVWHRQAARRKGEAPASLAADPDGVIAVGWVGARMASWSSPDGLSWQVHPRSFPQAPDGSGFSEDRVQVTDVVATDDGWLAVGRRDPACQINCDTDPIRAYVWISSDGVRWTRVADHKALRGGGMDTVARGAQGLVAAGVAAGHAAIWTSPDGTVWSRVPDDPMFRTKSMWMAQIDVAVRDGAIVIIGTMGSHDAARVRAWWSTDGRTWAKADVEKAADGAVGSVVATPDGFVAAGWSVGCPRDPDPDRSQGSIWVSRDGTSWRCDLADQGPDGFLPWSAASSDAVDVVVGSTDPPFEEDEEASPPTMGAVWYRTRP